MPYIAVILGGGLWLSSFVITITTNVAIMLAIYWGFFSFVCLFVCAGDREHARGNRYIVYYILPGENTACSHTTK